MIQTTTKQKNFIIISLKYSKDIAPKKCHHQMHKPGKIENAKNRKEMVRTKGDMWLQCDL